MENTFKEALEAKDLPKVRELLIEAVTRDPGQTVSIDSVREVLESTPGLFVEDDGRRYAESPDRMTPELTRKLIKDLKNNFSLEKFSLLTETAALHGVGENREADNEEEIVKSDSNTASDKASKPRCSCAKTTAIIMMILGCAAAIVGLCIPVKFLLGLGIGVFMVGSFFLYSTLKNN